MADERSKPGGPAGPSPNKINTLMALAGRRTAGPKQGSLDLGVEKQVTSATSSAGPTANWCISRTKCLSTGTIRIVWGFTKKFRAIADTMTPAQR
jgi:hypothetical protein